MKKITLIIICALTVISSSKANNLIIGTPTINGANISFTIQWENSWNVTSGPSNWDAVWIFVKRQTCDQSNQNPWAHADLSSGSVSGSILQADLSSDNKGVFVRRSAPGMGNITQETVTLTLGSAIGADNIGVYGMEMVNVPEGQFYVGDGRTDLNGFTDGTSDNPLLINSTKQSSGLGASSVYQKQNLGSSVALPSTFPLGYNRFYCMKYEITAAQYVAFLNTLTYNQQLKLQEDINATPPTSPVGTSMNSYAGYRIEVKTPGTSTTSITPAVYGCDATDDNVFDQSNDGLGLPVSIRVKDFLTYLDWAAIRPMTEFEYEKACRGTLTPVLNEFSWGTSDQTGVQPYYNLNRLSPNESLPSAPFGPQNVGQNYVWRVGATATAASDRVHAAATYYGILDMTGNVFERCIGGWNWDYSGFTINNGDGNIDANAFANVIGWPSFINVDINTIESYFPRRGASANRSEGMSVSNRQWASFGNGEKSFLTGGRGVRSF
ncbi:hypothetical protein A5893_11605 [Pedobacter psychrophilus]|uniref:Sulfatase-modifying factor enzyme-like domain-containing protein n=1 Tax=Pedobacter psychrophilus TaxID=1826909 RepID=A0A179DER0_9SPHI|nr:SUMF1/EgtB/PvdO family nonheme iron enzyme [Pedobacter psychrophilus]OAQ39302.1 hypothetical protein A5893_11605 [Pedobacter psychrophilus]